MKKIIFFGLLLISLMLFQPQIVSSENSTVVINEIGAYEQVGYEWIEIKNVSDTEINISDWYFWENQTDHALELVQGVTSTLSSDEIAIIVQDFQKFREVYTNTSTKIFDSSWGSLRESGEEIGLRDAGHEFTEVFTYVEARDFSLERIDAGDSEYSELNWMEHPDSNSAGEKNYWLGDLEGVETEADLIIQDEEDEIGLGNKIFKESVLEITTTTIFSENNIGTVTSTIDFVSSTADNLPLLSKEGAGGWLDGNAVVTTSTEDVVTSTTTEIIEEALEEGREQEEILEQNQAAKVFSAGDIVINEIISDPVSGGVEAVELFNNTDKEIDLESWKIREGGGSETDLNGKISSKGFHSIFKLKGNLNNSGDIVELIDLNDLVIDSVSYGNWDDGNIEDNAEFVKDPYSLARIIDGFDSDFDLNDFAATEFISIGFENKIIFNIEESSGDDNLGSSEKKVEKSKQEKKKDLVEFSKDDYFGIYINEIFPNPKGSDKDHEFIEIVNSSSSTVNLEGLKLGDNSSKRFLIPDFELDPREYAVFERSETGISLNNSNGDSVYLFFPDSTVLDFVEYKKGLEDQSYSRNFDNVWSWVETLTPEEENIFEKVVIQEVVEEKIEEKVAEEQVEEIEDLDQPIYVDNTDLLYNLEISEIFVNPKGVDSGEFIEIHNPTDQIIEISGLKIDDEDGGSKPYVVERSILIKSHEYLVFDKKQTGLTLNNTSDSVRLFFGESLLREIIYDSVKEDASYSFGQDGLWYWTSKITPGRSNKIVSLQNKPLSSTQKKKDKIAVVTNLSKVREFDPGDNLKFQGVVAVEPGILGSQYFYINKENISDMTSSTDEVLDDSETSGIQIYMYKKDFPELIVGDRVEVAGELVESKGELKLKISDKESIKKIGTDAKLAILEKEIVEIESDLQGSLISVSGEVTQLRGSYMYLDDGSEEIKVYFKIGAGINKKNLKEGDILSVTGILSKVKDGYQLLPRSQDDLKKIGTVQIGVDEAEKSFSMESLQRYFIFSCVGVILVLAGLLFKSRREVG